MSASKTATRATPKSGSRSQRRTTRTASRSQRSPDAIRLLKADHREVEALFAEYETTSGDNRKQALADEICQKLIVHTQVEEEILYPAAYEALDEDDLVDEAEVEHASAKELIAQIRASSPSEPLYDAKVKVLSEYIAHHVCEEEKELFPELKDTDLDLKALGQQIAERKAQLLAG